MPAPSLPSPVAGLAVALLAAGLVGAPLTAYADSSASPTPEVSAAAAPSPTPTTPSAAETATAEQTSTSSATPSQSATPEPTTSETATDEPSDADAEESASPDPETTTVARGGSDAVVAPSPAEDVAAAEEQVTAQAAGITFTKSASPTRVSRVGQVISYRFVATNNGTEVLDGVEITDELEGLGDLTCNRTEPSVTLQLGQTLSCSATLTVTQAVLDFGDLFNSATVFGTVPGVEGAPPDYVGANASARVVVDQNPSIALEASVSPSGTADAGDRLRYEATATNTGNVTLTGARITSSLDALDLDCDPSARATLAPGASISCAGSYRVRAADARRGRVSNELTARAEGPFGDPESGSDDVTDDRRLRVAVHKPAGDGSDSGLADTGGTDGTLPVGLAGLVALVGGTALLRRGLRG